MSSLINRFNYHTAFQGFAPLFLCWNNDTAAIAALDAVEPSSIQEGHLSLLEHNNLLTISRDLPLYRMEGPLQL
jgi:hypothetical protein